MARSIYICYFSIREPLVQTQVLPYLRELVKDGHELTLLTFEPDPAAISSMSDEWDETGIEWHWLKYHKSPSVPATLFDLANGIRFVSKLARKRKFDVYHVRGHIPAPIGAIAKRLHGGKMLFDIRGFMPEEYVDAGIWKEGSSTHRSVKRLEKWLIKNSDGFVVLTEKAREIMFPESAANGFDSLGRPVEVIPCCVDISRFAAAEAGSRESMRSKLGIGDRKAIVYVGSFGGWYMTREMIDLVKSLREQMKNIYFMVLTQRDQEAIREEIRNAGFSPDEFVVTGVSHRDIPSYLSAADIAISFIRPSYSKQSSSPTKIAEYLAMGLPVITNAGVGDVDELIKRHKVGVLLDDFSDAGYREAGRQIDELGDIADRCRHTARELFDLETVAGPKYRNLYRVLTEPKEK